MTTQNTLRTKTEIQTRTKIFHLGDYSNEDDIPDYKLQEHNRSKEGVAEEIPFSDAVSFYEILKDQLQMQELTPEQRDIAEYLIGSLDDDGLLRKNMESIMDELAIYRGIYTTEEELNKILEIIQDFDPAGIGARSLQEMSSATNTKKSRFTVKTNRTGHHR